MGYCCTAVGELILIKGNNMQVYYCKYNGEIVNGIEPSFSLDGLYENMTFYAVKDWIEPGYITHAVAEKMIEKEGYEVCFDRLV